MDAEDLAGRLVRDDLDEAVGLAERHGLAARRERELADGHRPAVLLRFRLTEADRRHLRPAIGAGRDVGVVDGSRILPRERFRRDDTLGHRLVCQQRRSGHVADRIHALHRRFHRGRDFHEIALHLHAERFQAHALHARGTTDGHEHLLGVDRPRIGRHPHA